jgi:hypothetical protein
LVRAERVLGHVGFTVSPISGKMSATDYAQMSAADTAANEIHALSFVVVANFAALLSSDALMSGAAIYAGNDYESNKCSKRGYGDVVSACSIFCTAL